MRIYFSWFVLRYPIGSETRGYATRKTSVKRRKKRICTPPRRQLVSCFASLIKQRVFLHQFVPFESINQSILQAYSKTCRKNRGKSTSQEIDNMQVLETGEYRSILTRDWKSIERNTQIAMCKYLKLLHCCHLFSVLSRTYYSFGCVVAFHRSKKFNWFKNLPS